jgi:hypothetical protein
MASDRAHANDGVMSGMWISKVKSQGTIKQTGYVGTCNRGEMVQGREREEKGES